MKLLKTDNDFYLSDNDLNNRAELVLNEAVHNNNNSVINIFEAISLPFSGENYKKQLFIKIFNLVDINSEWDENLGFIIPSENRTLKTVVSHMDLISTFNKGFQKNNIYKIEDNKLIGALDNTFTNAVLINSILNKRDKNTTYLFTLDEETTQYAIRDYMKRFGTEQFIVNLDVTNDGFNKNSSIEYDEPNWKICKQLKKNLKAPFFTKDRECDDLDQVMKVDGYGFSYCLPTKKTIHSYKNYTNIDKIEPYMNGLEYIIHELKIDSIEYNIKYLSIDDSLSYSKFDKMKKNDIYIQPKYDEKEFIHIKDSFENEVAIRDKDLIAFSELVYEVAKDCKLNKKETYELELLISDTLFSFDIITFEEFTKYIPEDLFFELLSLKLLVKSHDSYYDFDINLINTSEFKIYSELSKYKNINALSLYKLISTYEINEFSYDELLSLEKDHRAQNLSAPINALLTKGLIIKEKNNDMFKIIKS